MPFGQVCQMAKTLKEYHAILAELAVINEMEEGDYHRGGPFFATLHRIFCQAFKDSGYSILLTNDGAFLKRG